MKCVWEDTGDLSRPRKVRCIRCKLELTVPTTTRRGRIGGNCRAWPFLHEWGYWLALILEVFGLSKRRWGWLLWKLRLGPPGPCATCAEREAWLNSLPGKVVTAWCRLRGKPANQSRSHDSGS